MVRRALALYLLSAGPALVAPHYSIDPAQSSLGFSVIENGAPVSGKFSAFGGAITFDPKDLAQSHITVTVKLGSVTSDNEDMPGTLQEPDWFDVAKFPTATFESRAVKALGGNKYEAAGQLTIKGVSQPLTLPFTLTAYDATHATANGQAVVKRTGFHVGWADTKQVQDDVAVTFAVTANAQ